MVSQIIRPSQLAFDSNSNFNYLRDVYEDCLNRYRVSNIYSDWKEAQIAIKKGRKVLESQDEIDTYIAFYGAQHYYKLEAAFDALNISSIDSQELEIFCYGCGAGTEPLSLFSYCQEKQINLDIKTLTLIEPSRIALDRGFEYITNRALQNEKSDQIEIKKIYKTLGDLEENDIASESETLKLHLFSNVLDIKEIDLKSLCSLINNTQVGTNYFICVNPYNSESRSRIDSFYDELSNFFNLSDISTNYQDIFGKKVWMMNSGQYKDNHTVYRYHKIFQAVST